MFPTESIKADARYSSPIVNDCGHKGFRREYQDSFRFANSLQEQASKRAEKRIAGGSCAGTRRPTHPTFDFLKHVLRYGIDLNFGLQYQGAIARNLGRVAVSKR
jgi:hypothetical protein